ncbi:hypothetical protein [Desulfosoma caldarium]|uniref:DDE family transposase n=1 Tax=Desulfosoma caldarium TaxID=610254 RepID=A0A3N1UEZ1_9BACT|nr:hypothetical protein [Desulfosoma caldarium]ROQ89824.1 hypothetical protein EDC27_2938 [Desulfosoma caldarium]
MRRTLTATKGKATIDGVEVTHNTLTGLDGLRLFVRYLCNIQIFRQIGTFFGSTRGRRTGQPIIEIFKQLLCFFMDGTGAGTWSTLTPRPRTRAMLPYPECEPDRLVSFHGVKSFRRALFGRPQDQDAQMVLPFARPHTVG